MSKGIINSTVAVFILFIMVTLIASSAVAQKPQVTINEVMVDFDSQSISIMGENFDIGPNPTTVSLGGFGNLNITTNTSNLLMADLPNGVPAGDYLLSVSSGPGPKKNAQQSITIGAQGPQGDMGDQGDQGDQGPQGPTGATGPQGPTGATGPQGPQGDPGTAGTDGADGATGPAGADGATGPAGTDGQDGVDGISFATTSTSAAISCPDGSVVADSEYKEDLNSNGVGDMDEPTAFIIPGVCDGEDGQDGTNGSQGLQGFNGDDGDDGADGLNSVMLIQDEADLTPDCPNGEFGKAVYYGLDLNENGELDFPTELKGGTVICDGEQGEEGPEGPSGGAGTWSTYLGFNCSSDTNCSSERSCAVGQILADTTCGFENAGKNNVWVKYAGGTSSNERTSMCNVRNDSNSSGLYIHAIYCVDE